jgi:hypothetical protein
MKRKYVVEMAPALAKALRESGVRVKIRESQTVNVITYNSGYGERLEVVSKDPERRKTAQVVAMQLGSNGQPQMKVKLGTDTYVADWNDQYRGWVVDFN